MLRSLKYGLPLTLLLACGRHSSSHPAPIAAPAPNDNKPGLTQPDTTPDNAGTTGTASQPQSPSTGSTTPSTSPVTNNPGPATNPQTPGTQPGSGNDGNTSATQPAVLSADIQALWGIGLAQKPRSCATYYDLRSGNSLALHVLCPDLSGQGLWLQTETFSLVSDAGGKANFKRVRSTCNKTPTQANVILAYSLAKAADHRTLTLTENKSATPALKEIAPETLAGDLLKSTELHGRKVTRGCFMDGHLSKFEAGKGAQ